LPGISIGDIVRIPLGGRKVRGYVTAVSDGTPERPLRPIAARSGSRGVFDAAMLRSLRWAATQYVAPLSTVLARCAPPNLPRRKPRNHEGAVADVDGTLTSWSERQVTGGRTRPAYLVTGDPLPAVTSAIAPILRSGKNVIVTAPTVVEAHAVADLLRGVFRKRVRLATSDESPAVRTTSWSQIASDTGSVVVGTREVAFWGIDGLGLAVVIDEGRRGYKSPQTPTFHIRDVLMKRSTIERFSLLLTGPVPTAEALSSGVEVIEAAGRVWPLVEVVDRSQDGDGSGAVGDRVRQAITALGDGATVFVLVPRRGGSFRCSRCRELRKCPECDAMLERSGSCARCGRSFPQCVACGGARFEALGGGVSRTVDDLARIFGNHVGPVGSDCRIAVGTERDLVGLPPVDLVVVIDPDTGILAPNYRADEDALRLLARATLAARPGRGRRALIQTSLADHRVFDALRSGSPTDFMTETLRRREASGFPPIGDLIALETDATDAGPTFMEAAGEVSLLGPAKEGDRERWLIQGRDLSAVRLRLRSAVQHVRDGGARVRVDADPVDL
jgi:primosomal protein N' (replication factor Y)